MKQSILFTIFVQVFSFLSDVHLQDLPAENMDISSEMPTVILNQKSELNQYYRCLPSVRVNMIARCPAEYKDNEIIGKCEKGLFPLAEEDISIIIPTTSRKTGIHYLNQYCALCHNDSSTDLWELSISWPRSFFSSKGQEEATEEEILSTLHYNDTLKSYRVNVTNNLLSCSFRPVRPKNWSLPACISKIIWQCPSVHEGPKDCSQFSGHVVCDWPNYAFINAECARCNNFALKSEEECSFLVPKSAHVQTIFKLRKSSNSNSCSIPAIAKYYC